MALKQGFKARTIAAVLAAGFVTPMLAGCSGRDTEAMEKVAAINAAAARAEAAASRAEKAAAKLGANNPAPVVTEEAPDPVPDDNNDQGDDGSDNSNG